MITIKSLLSFYTIDNCICLILCRTHVLAPPPKLPYEKTPLKTPPKKIFFVLK